ncbi:uncharacterized protein LOC115887126 isoform X2 [Sitophilus oryzae]|uniref:Uncharacterized protein LOC115887126 isoform X2 n=1 Tax=Sitophilus oryzae TaxID=7048 RepID=A0A6J2YEI1_SITOR|nr:uncharacterized protein LOC115887126 isoform X2 [Sitophilus oryzae]
MSSVNEDICYTPFKKYDSILNDKSESFENKVQSLIDVWRSISELNLSQFDIRYVIQIIDWAKLHALNIVLTGEWRTIPEADKNILLDNIEKAQANLAIVNDAFSSRCQKLADVVKKPWEDPVLTNLIQERDVEIGPKEIEFFCVETAYLVSVRLKKLCENHCEDLALNLVSNFLKYKKLAITQNYNLNATETQLWFIFDIYVALLHKFQDKNKIIQQFEELQLEEGVCLIKRFAKKRVQISKIWRNCNKIAIFGCRFFLSKALMKYNEDLKVYLIDLLKTYLTLSNTDTLLQEFVVSIRSITNLADAAGLCVMCEIIHKEAANVLRHFAIEMYIRALTTDMNELERLKHVNEEDKVKLTTSRLANTFTSLADLLNDHVKVARECVLTAFSLEPTQDRLKKIEELARTSGFPVLDTGQEWKCRLHPPALPSDDIAWTCPECGEWMCKPELSAPLKMNLALHEALQESVLGISEALCDDLVVCLSNPRYQILSWLLSWSDLYRLCIMYLNDPEKTKNFVTELKFVDVDYSLFEHIKREPVDEYTGIEKGYEQYLDLNFVSDEETSSVSEDSMSHDKYRGMGSDGTGEPYIPPLQPRSDPNTLKSLRMFRPNLKRKKEESEVTVPEKRVTTPDSAALTVGNYSSSQNSCTSSASGASSSKMYAEPANAKAPQNLAYLQSAFASNYPTLTSSVTNLSNYNAYTSVLLEPSGQFSSQSSSNMAKSCLEFALNRSTNLRCYPPKLEKTHPSTTSAVDQSNSVFSSSLSSGTSTEYVSNIIKSNLTYGVPKVSPSSSVSSPAQGATNSYSLDFRKPAQNQMPLRAVKKQIPRPVKTLDDVIKEAAEEIESDLHKSSTESKNGVAATLPQLGGQVAIKEHQLIQVTEISHNLLTKSQQETSSPSGTKGECKTKQRNRLRSAERRGKSPNQTAGTYTPALAKQCGTAPEPPTPISKGPTLQPEISMEVTKGRMPLQYLKDHSLPREIVIRLEGIPARLLSRFQLNHALGPATTSERLTCQKGRSSTQGKPSSAPLSTTRPFPDQQIPPARSPTHLETSVIIRPSKTTEVVAQETGGRALNSSQATPSDLEQTCASTNLVKNRQCPLTSSVHKNEPDYAKHKRISRERTTCTPADTPKTTTQITADCDKDKSHLIIQTKENQKTDDEGTAAGDGSSKTVVARHSEGSQNKTDDETVADGVLMPDATLDCQECIVTSDNSGVSLQVSEVRQSNSNKGNISLSVDSENVNTEPCCDNIFNVQNNENGLCEKKVVDSIDNDPTDLPNVREVSNSDQVAQIRRAYVPNNTPKMKQITSLDILQIFQSQPEFSFLARDNYGKYERVNGKKKNVAKKVKRYGKISTFKERKKRKKGRRELFSYVPLWHDYSRPKEAFISKWRTVFLPEHVSKPLQIFEPIKNSRHSRQFILSSDDVEDMSETDKENIKVAPKDLDLSSSSCAIASSSSIEKSKSGATSLLSSATTRKHKIESNLKKYKNRHRRKHQGVPCFKLDQELDSQTDQSSTIATISEALFECLPGCTNGPPSRFLEYGFRTKNLSDRIQRKGCINRDGFSSPDENYRPSSELQFILVSEDDDATHSHASRLKGILKTRLNDNISAFIKKSISFTSTPKIVLVEPENKDQSVRSVLRNVPGLNDFSEVRPGSTVQVVNVVQVSSTRASTVANQNMQTSTQVSPHIQRIGQPKLPDQKSESASEQAQSASSVTPVSAQNPKPSTSQSPTLINILNSQIMPGQRTAAAVRQAPFINILSQQIIKQPNQPVRKPTKIFSNASPNTPSNTSAQPATVIKVDSDGNSEPVQPVSANVKIAITAAPATDTTTVATTTPSQAGTILQFICKSSSLPKFQQAFGKTIYQTSGSSDEGNGETSTPSAVDNAEPTQSTTNLETKKAAAKTVPANVQPIAGNVIFRGQVPVGQTVSLIPPGSSTRQLFRITGSTHEQISLVKETVIQNKMSALLAAALQGKPKITEQNGELVEEYSATRITLCRPGTVPNATRIVKPVQLQIPANVIKTPQTNMSSTTLEQLREFDMVYKQVKERSSNPAQPETTAVTSQESPQQRISFTYVNQVQKYTHLSPVVVVSSYNPIQQSASPALSVPSQSTSADCFTQATSATTPKVSVKSSKGKSIKSATTKSPPAAVPTTIQKPQQKPQEDEHTTQRIFDILAEYAEQLRNSPDLNNKPAPRRRSNPPTNPSSTASGSASSKKKKKKSNNTSSNLVETESEDLTMGSEDSSGGIVQLSMTDEEQSQSASITPPDTNLEPASSSNAARPLLVTDTSNQPRNVIIADSSVGEALKMPNTTLIMPGSYIMPVSVVKGSQQIAVVSGGSKILTSVPARSGQNMLLFQSFVNQNKKPGGISAVKYSTIQPFSGISSRTVAGVGAQPPVVLPSNSVATVTLGQPITLKKIEDGERANNAELLLTISQPSEAIKMDKSPDIPQPDSTNLSNDGSETKMDETPRSAAPSSDSVFSSIQKTSSVATSVIASVIKKEEESRSAGMAAGTIKGEEQKRAGRIESVLVNASASNGPMLSHTNSRYRKPCEGVESTTQTVKEFSQNSGKVPTNTKVFKNNAIYYAIRTKKTTSKKLDSDLQKQAAIERELRLQKSLSEECEDLGVDEPSTSDLFPEADLLFDSNHSPSYEQSGQKIQVTEAKAKASMNLFSDDENSSPMRNDLFDYVEYQVEADVGQVNGDGSVNAAASSGDDTTLVPNCATISEVTLNSPISPDYTDTTHTVNKYKYKYTNRKKCEKGTKAQTENTWSEVTSSEDILQVLQEGTPISVQEETVVDDGTIQVQTLVEEKRALEADQTKCPFHGIPDRTSRRTSRKPCSCLNGSKSPGASNIKKRVNAGKPQAPIPNKKPLVAKKR